jgi:hypothetical protein
VTSIHLIRLSRSRMGQFIARFRASRQADGIYDSDNV